MSLHGMKAPGWVSRFWSWCGYGMVRAPDGDDLDGYADGRLAIDVLVRLCFADRLRVLISGTFNINMSVKTDVTVDRCATFSAVGILPPSFKPLSARAEAIFGPSKEGGR